MVFMGFDFNSSDLPSERELFQRTLQNLAGSKSEPLDIDVHGNVVVAGIAQSIFRSMTSLVKRTPPKPNRLLELKLIQHILDGRQWITTQEDIDLICRAASRLGLGSDAAENKQHHPELHQLINHLKDDLLKAYASHRNEEYGALLQSYLGKHQAEIDASPLAAAVNSVSQAAIQSSNPKTAQPVKQRKPLKRKNEDSSSQPAASTLFTRRIFSVKRGKKQTAAAPDAAQSTSKKARVNEFSSKILQLSKLLLAAADKGDEAAVNQLIEEGADINYIGKDHHTPLYKALLKSNRNIIVLLIKKGAKLSAQIASTIHFPSVPGKYTYNFPGLELLYWTIGSGEYEIADLLMKRHPNLNEKNPGGYTPLMVAAMNGHEEIIKLLLDNGAKIDVTNDGCTALHYAAQYGQDKPCRLLLQHGANPLEVNREGYTATLRCNMLRDENWKKAAQVILKSTPEVKEYDDTLFQRKLIAHSSSIGGITLFDAASSPMETDSPPPQSASRASSAVDSQATSSASASRQLESQQRVTLTGFRSPLFWQEMYQNTQALAKLCPEMFSKGDARLLIDTCSLASKVKQNSTQEIFKRWSAGLPVFIDTGFITHHVTILLWKERFVLCNRGRGAFLKHVYQAATFQKILLTQAIIDKIVAQQNLSMGAFIKFFSTELPAALGFKQTSVEKAIEKSDIGWQEVGNCSWSNSEGIIFPFLVLNEVMQAADMVHGDIRWLDLSHVVSQQMRKFENWRSFQQIQSIKKHVVSIAAGQRTFTPDYDLIVTAFYKNYPMSPLSRIHPAIVAQWQQVHPEIRAMVSYFPRSYLEKKTGWVAGFILESITAIDDF